MSTALPDFELFGWHAEVHFDALADDAHRVRVDWEYGRERFDFAGQEVEARAVTRALHHTVFELAFPKHAAVVGADVVDGTPRPVDAVPEAEALTLGIDHRDLARCDIGCVGHTDESAQAASPSTSAMRPIRGASALMTRARTCTSGMSFTTRWKNPRTRSCSAVERSRPRDMM